MTGTLAPGESPRTGPLPRAGRSVDLRARQRVARDLYNAVVFASAESAVGTPLAAALTRVPPPLATRLNLRNAAYAVQWWVFGLFAIWMWWGWFRGPDMPA